MPAGDLRAGEAVVTLGGGGSATVAWVRAVPGPASMDHLTVANGHTYAVGASQTVVHNDTCEDLIGTAEEAATNESRASATSMRVEDAEGSPVALPKATFTSEYRRS